MHRCRFCTFFSLGVIVLGLCLTFTPDLWKSGIFIILAGLHSLLYQYLRWHDHLAGALTTPPHPFWAFLQFLKYQAEFDLNIQHHRWVQQRQRVRLYLRQMLRDRLLSFGHSQRLSFSYT